MGNYKNRLDINKNNMRQFITIIFLIITVSLSNLTFGQDSQRNFSEIMQTYYLHRDKDIVELTINFVNNPKADYKRLEPILTGFFGALFSSDTIVRNDFVKNSKRFENLYFTKLFTFLSVTNIDSIYSKTPLSPAFNDMNWSSYFATGNVKYLDKILSNIPLAENRIDQNLFLTGVTAKWSLCSNARQDKQVKEYLGDQKDNKKVIKEILKKKPQEFSQEMKDVLIEQRAKGLWN
jgi:hypothetical protein